MTMPHREGGSLWHGLSAAGELGGRFLWGAAAEVRLSDLATGSSLGAGRDRLRGRSVLLAHDDQLAAGLALIELDGMARRIVLCPAGVPPTHVAAIMATAEIDAVVSDGADAGLPDVGCRVASSAAIAPASVERGRDPTEWILLTSGTTGVPKLVVHDLASLAGHMGSGRALGQAAVWSTFYDIRRYGGLQIFLRALLGGGSMVLSSAAEATADFLARAGTHKVTHISGTPSHWRRALMSPAARAMAPRYVRLSGEIADQAILEQVRAVYAPASVAHAFASTEAGLAFDVDDGHAGFPASLVGGTGGPAELEVVDGSLHIRSPRTARRYLDAGAVLRDAKGFVDTGDLVERRDDRYFFAGRRDGIVNVGGIKVHPEEVEAVINTHPGVRMSLVKARRSPVTGAVVVADVVMLAGFSGESVEREILEICRRALPRHKVPATIRFVAALAVNASGKLRRRDA
jgi:acyl-coenzyme A synthetase/AMP-(fatty) acid ligase